VSVPGFVWDRRKAAANRRKHGVTFEDASAVFADEWALTVPDDLHSESEEEEREVTIGRAASGAVLTVVHTLYVDGAIRIISARYASRRERQAYDGSDTTG
jgi:uncharacterized DUF497 family protein